jgi:hypothetical protein
MSRRHTAVHEAAHAFFWFYGGASLARAQIWAEPAMGVDEWQGYVDPGNTAKVDMMYAIMSAYAGGLAEAKMRLQESTGRPMRFDYMQDENAFVNRVITHPSTVPWSPGRTAINLIDAKTGLHQTQLLVTASFGSDVQGPDSAHALANAIGRLDVLIPLCRGTRQFLDRPAIWHTIQRFGHELDANSDIQAPLVRDNLEGLFQAESAFAAHDLWIARDRQLWDDLADWYKAQGADIPLV